MSERDAGRVTFTPEKMHFTTLVVITYVMTPIYFTEKEKECKRLRYFLQGFSHLQ